MPVRWFAVKTVYRSTAIGKPRVTDGDYDPDGTLVEERVVLLRARDHEDAIRKSEKDAKQYAKETHTNPYGQSVVTRCLKAIESLNSLMIRLKELRHGPPHVWFRNQYRTAKLSTPFSAVWKRKLN